MDRLALSYFYVLTYVGDNEIKFIIDVFCLSCLFLHTYFVAFLIFHDLLTYYEFQQVLNANLYSCTNYSQ